MSIPAATKASPARAVKRRAGLNQRLSVGSTSCSGYSDSYLNDNWILVRYTSPPPSPTTMSCFVTSATRISRTDHPAVVIASAAAASHELGLVPIMSITRYTLMTTSRRSWWICQWWSLLLNLSMVIQSCWSGRGWAWYPCDRQLAAAHSDPRPLPRSFIASKRESSHRHSSHVEAESPALRLLCH